MIIPQGLDPADFVAKHGADAVREAAEERRPLVEYMVRRTIGRHDLSTVEGQSAAVADALPILERLTDPVRRSEYAHLLADLAGVAESSVLQALDASGRGRPAEVVAERRSAAPSTTRRARDAEAPRARPRPVRDVRPAAHRDHFRTPRARTAVRARCATPDGDVAVVAGGDDEKLAALVSLARGRTARRRGDARLRGSVWSRLQEFVLKAKSDALRMQLQKLNPTTDAGYDELFTRARRRSTASSAACGRTPRRVQCGRAGDSRHGRVARGRPFRTLWRRAAEPPRRSVERSAARRSAEPGRGEGDHHRQGSRARLRHLRGPPRSGPGRRLHARAGRGVPHPGAGPPDRTRASRSSRSPARRPTPPPTCASRSTC